MPVKFHSIPEFLLKFPDEQKCYDYIIGVRWKGKPKCVYCENTNVYIYSNGKKLKCAECKRQFSITSGTIFESSNIPLQKWFLAFYLFSSRKKGISSIQLSKDLDITQKSAWMLLQKIRFVISSGSYNTKLKGTVEADETYIGGKRKFSKRGRGAEHKTPVFGMVERNGDVRAMPVIKCNAATLKPLIHENVQKGSSLMTDEWGAYNGLSKNYKHQVVKHAEREYVRGKVHTNTIEGFWSHLKRGIKGTYHQTSKKHLKQYVKEFEHRYNTRNDSDSVRFNKLMKQTNQRMKITDK